MGVWAVGTPGVLGPGKMDYVNLAHKTQRLLCAGQTELHSELRCAFGILVDCKQGPLVVRSSHCIRSYGRARYSRLRRGYGGQTVRAVFRFVYADGKYLVLLVDW